MPAIGKRVLLIDDDEQLVMVLSMKLARAGYMVESAVQASRGHCLALHNEYDIILLDIVMPEQSGLEICGNLRRQGVLTPILVLSGQSDESIVVQGLDAGADDYVTKPFGNNELAARMRALLRRSRKSFASQSVERCEIALDVSTRTVRHGSVFVALTEKETLLLKRLMDESPAPVSRLALLHDVWGIGSRYASNRLDVYVRRLRKKLQTFEGSCSIYTLRSGGYYFDVPYRLDGEQ